MIDDTSISEKPLYIKTREGTFPTGPEYPGQRGYYFYTSLEKGGRIKVFMPNLSDSDCNPKYVSIPS